MVLKKEQLIETIVTKNGIRILRLLFRKPYMKYGLSEIALLLNISKSNVLGYLRKIQAVNLVRQEKEGRKKLYHINSGLELVRVLFHLFMIERKDTLRPASKNAVDFIFERLKDKVDVFILFGSLTYSLENEESDIDILVVGDTALKQDQFSFLPHRVELHIVSREELENMKDFVVLEALMNGITYKGDIFNILFTIRSFPKSYALFRLQKAKEHLAKASKLTGEAKNYYEQLGTIALGELESLLLKKHILPKRLVKRKVSIDMLEKLLSKEGDNIWLT